jgi:hypothetical protein
MSASNRLLSNRLDEWGARGVNVARNLSRVSPFVQLAARPCPSALFLAHKPFSNPVSALRTRYFEKHLTRKKRPNTFLRAKTHFFRKRFFHKRLDEVLIGRDWRKADCQDGSDTHFQGSTLNRNGSDNVLELARLGGG